MRALDQKDKLFGRNDSIECQVQISIYIHNWLLEDKIMHDCRHGSELFNLYKSQTQKLSDFSRPNRRADLDEIGAM